MLTCTQVKQLTWSEQTGQNAELRTRAGTAPDTVAEHRLTLSWTRTLSTQVPTPLAISEHQPHDTSVMHARHVL